VWLEEATVARGGRRKLVSTGFSSSLCMCACIALSHPRRSFEASQLEGNNLQRRQRHLWRPRNNSRPDHVIHLVCAHSDLHKAPLHLDLLPVLSLTSLSSPYPTLPYPIDTSHNPFKLAQKKCSPQLHLPMWRTILKKNCLPEAVLVRSIHYLKILQFYYSMAKCPSMPL
jgi:hypothetical protein